MNKLITKLVLVTVLAVSFISCSKDDETQPPIPVTTSPNIIDDWNLEKYGFMNDANTIENEFDWSSDCASKKDFLILNVTNTFTVNYFSSACENTFFAQENGTYTLNASNDRLTISGGTDWDGFYAVLTLTNTELVLKKIPDQGVSNKLGNVNFYKFSRRGE